MAQFAHYFIKYKYDGPQSLVVLRCGLGDVLDFQAHLFCLKFAPKIYVFLFGKSMEIM